MTAALQLGDVCKRFGAVQALDRVALTVQPGEVHGLIGSNGSGKSTLVKTLAGYHSPDGGWLRIWGKDVPLPVGDGRRHGIATIHQDLGLAENLSVLENVIATSGFGVGRARRIAWRARWREVSGLLERLGLSLDLDAEVGSLSRGDRTLVAVARAVCELDHAGGSPLLVTDEPTAALSSSEAGALWSLLRRVTGAGGAALFISHHLEEVRSRCDRVTVLRDGRVVLSTSCEEAGIDELVEAMLGDQEASDRNQIAASEQLLDTRVLEVANLEDDVLDGVSFAIGAGEVVGFTGLLGMGQERLPRILAGIRTRTAGWVSVEGRELRGGDMRAAAEAGVVAVPAERQRDGLWLEASVSENLGIVGGGRFWRGGRYRYSAERSAAYELMRELDVRPCEPTRRVGELSGGNQQKVLLAKWLQLEPRVIALHEPTQGVDIAAKREIHRIVRRYAQERRAAVLIVSSDHEELAEHCDRVAVLAAGRVRGELLSHELSPHSILEMVTAA